MPPSKKTTSAPVAKSSSRFKAARCSVVGCVDRATHLRKVFTVRAPTHCKHHAPKNEFFEYSSRLCEVETCRFRASFAPTHESTKPCRCADHKLSTDINWEKKTCATENCDKKPSFAPPGDPAVRCKTCRIEGDVDVNNKKCDKCKTRQAAAIVAGRETEGMRYCLTCAKEMGFSYRNGRSPHCACGRSAMFDEPDTPVNSVRFCGQCRDPSKHIDIKHESRTCVACCTTRGSRVHDGHLWCQGCFVKTFPHIPTLRNYKTKQGGVEDFLKERFGDKITMRYDQKIERIVPEAASAGAGGGFVHQEFEDERPCASSGRKPDVLIDMGEWVVIVEVDEGQHKQDSYKSSCENKRTMQIFDDLGRRPTVFIRFNPDNYVDAAGNRVQSPWTVDGRTGSALHVSAENRPVWQTRLDTLAVTLEHAMKTRPMKDISTVFLYFDGY
jgi:hypothetical protein